jgi:hypothetical protein
MLAFLIGHDTMDRIICLLRKKEIPGLELYTGPEAVPDFDAATDLGRQLYELNLSAMMARYDEPGADPDFFESYSYREPAQGLGIPESYKALRCFLYQCSEGDVPEHPMFKQLTRVAETMGEVYLALNSQCIDDTQAYQIAPWG